MPSPLLIVELVLRQQKEGATLDQLGRLVADYLGPDRNLALSDACKLGSTKLLNWMWACSSTSTADRTPHWSLLNYLRSDPAYYEYQFHESVRVAATKGDLRVLEWLMEHFSGCQVPDSVVETAAEEGRLDILELLVKHDAAVGGSEALSFRKKRKVESTRSVGGELGIGNVVQWGGNAMVSAARKKHYDVVRFLYDNTPRDSYAETLDDAIEFLLEAGETNLLEELLPSGRCVLDYGEYSSNPDVLERRFAAGLLDDEFDAGIAIEKLARSGRLDLMKKVWKRHEQAKPRGDWMQDWVRGMATACQARDLAVLKWMVEHTSGRAAIAHLKEYHRVPWLLNDAAHEGHLDVMKYLHEQGAAVDYGGALLCAIRRGKTEAATWLVEHFPPSD